MRSLVLVKFHFLSMWNWRQAYFARIVEPVAYLVLLGGGLSASLGDSYSNFLLSGIICSLGFRAGLSAACDVSNDRKWGVFAIYVMQGGRVFGYLASVVGFFAGVFLLQVLCLVGVAVMVFGVGVVQVEQFFLFLFLGVLVVGGWVGLGASMGSRVQSYARRDLIVTLTSLPVVLAAPLFYPLENAPVYIKWISVFNPLTYQAGWFRSDASQVLLAYGWAVVWCLAGLALASFLLSSADRVSRER